MEDLGILEGSWISGKIVDLDHSGAASR